ncbi:MAG: hypothetical protein C4560_08235 [Nitrospiraceae bacterium]|nr:MAG: hypothetical protein C4560_08235 [Nitrospiraceae bacterium]
MDRKIAKQIFLFVIIILSGIFIPRITSAATYYISPAGSNSNPGTESQPFATFSYAFSKMSGGDTLYIADGVYHQQITGMPSGSPGNYTKIYAVNDHKVDIDGQGVLPSSGWQALLYINGKSYVEIKGLKVHNSSYSNDVCEIENSNNVIFRVMGCWQAGDYKHDNPVKISNSSNMLLEDVWAFGRGRYSVHMATDATNVILRRVVTRWDDGAYSSEPIAGFSVYKAYNNILENTITFDHANHPDWFTAGHQGYYVISWNTSYPESRENKFYGSIALNLPVSGFSVETNAQPDIDNHYFKDCVSVDTYRGFNLLKANTSTVEQCSFINSSGSSSGSHGLFNGVNSTNASVKNSLVIGNAAYGFNNNGGGISISHSGAYNNTNGNYSGTSCATGCRTDNPQLKYPVRIESTSTYKGAGENGMDIGANIINRYENGVLTSKALWPWPYEDWIKEDMCDSATLESIGRTGASTPKWCTTNKTLTQYIWEYLGTQCPEDICKYSDPAPSPPLNLKIITQ